MKHEERREIIEAIDTAVHCLSLGAYGAAPLIFMVIEPTLEKFMQKDASSGLTADQQEAVDTIFTEVTENTAQMTEIIEKNEPGPKPKKSRLGLNLTRG